MKYILEGHGYHHEVYTIIQLFYPNEKYELTDCVSRTGVLALSGLDGNRCYARLYNNGLVADEREKDVTGLSEKQLKNALKAAVFECFREFCGYAPPWGILTGIRPTKKALELINSGLDEEGAAGVFINEYLVSPEKAKLCVETALSEKALLAASTPDDVSLYAGIPFCPTRCLYCSFTSYPVSRYKHMTSAYLSALQKELGYIADEIMRKGQRLESLYIGGGTPTTLDAGELDALLGFLRERFNLSQVREFCVEAGRPDTITVEKLEIMRRHGVGRISVNPQTMNDATLELIGRKHTAGEFLEAYRIAKALGFSINVDIILGLPGETADDVRHTLSRILELRPESLTAHTLCVKRASGLHENLAGYRLSEAETLREMSGDSYSMCKSAGLLPYYLYRQKNALGNYENVGYAIPGHECLYNVQIMQEKQTVYAAGAGSVTKLCFSGENRVERSFNVKNVEEYIARIDEMIDRKKGLR